MNAISQSRAMQGRPRRSSHRSASAYLQSARRSSRGRCCLQWTRAWSLQSQTCPLMRSQGGHHLTARVNSASLQLAARVLSRRLQARAVRRIEASRHRLSHSRRVTCSLGWPLRCSAASRCSPRCCSLAGCSQSCQTRLACTLRDVLSLGSLGRHGSCRCAKRCRFGLQAQAADPCRIELKSKLAGPRPSRGCACTHRARFEGRPARGAPVRCSPGSDSGAVRHGGRGGAAEPGAVRTGSRVKPCRAGYNGARVSVGGCRRLERAMNRQQRFGVAECTAAGVNDCGYGCSPSGRPGARRRLDRPAHVSGCRCAWRMPRSDVAFLV